MQFLTKSTAPQYEELSRQHGRGFFVLVAEGKEEPVIGHFTPGTSMFELIQGDIAGLYDITELTTYEGNTLVVGAQMQVADTRKPSIVDLPPELLAHVFSFLNSKDVRNAGVTQQLRLLGKRILRGSRFPETHDRSKVVRLHKKTTESVRWATQHRFALGIEITFESNGLYALSNELLYSLRDLTIYVTYETDPTIKQQQVESWSRLIIAQSLVKLSIIFNEPLENTNEICPSAISELPNLQSLRIQCRTSNEAIITVTSDSLEELVLIHMGVYKLDIECPRLHTLGLKDVCLHNNQQSSKHMPLLEKMLLIDVGIWEEVEDTSEWVLPFYGQTPMLKTLVIDCHTEPFTQIKFDYKELTRLAMKRGWMATIMPINCPKLRTLELTQVIINPDQASIAVMPMLDKLVMTDVVGSGSDLVKLPFYRQMPALKTLVYKTATTSTSIYLDEPLPSITNVLWKSDQWLFHEYDSLPNIKNLVITAVNPKDLIDFLSLQYVVFCTDKKMNIEKLQQQRPDIRIEHKPLAEFDKYAAKL